MRHRRRSRNPLGEDLVPVLIGAAGGALVMYLYNNAIQQAAAAKSNSLTVSTSNGQPTG